MVAGDSILTLNFPVRRSQAIPPEEEPRRLVRTRDLLLNKKNKCCFFFLSFFVGRIEKMKNVRVQLNLQ